VCGPRDDASLERAIELIARHSRAPSAGNAVRWQGEDGLRSRALGAAAVTASGPTAD
jgi:hypothetical protein